MNFLRWRFQEKPASNYKMLRMINDKGETIALEIIAISFSKDLQLGIILKDPFHGNSYTRLQISITNRSIIVWTLQTGSPAVRAESVEA
jgi:hypothetical protein